MENQTQTESRITFGKMQGINKFDDCEVDVLVDGKFVGSLKRVNAGDFDDYEEQAWYADDDLEAIGCGIRDERKLRDAKLAVRACASAMIARVQEDNRRVDCHMCGKTIRYGDAYLAKFDGDLFCRPCYDTLDRKTIRGLRGREDAAQAVPCAD